MKLTALVAVAVLTLAGCGSSSPAPVTKTVTKTQAPAECGTVLDLFGEFATAVSVEHKTMGKAFTKAGQDGDVLTALVKSARAARVLSAKVTALTPRVSAAGQVCRAAIK
jgi:ABC-type glycerol-3-phosphate transport system substrate-binding protein